MKHKSKWTLKHAAVLGVAIMTLVTGFSFIVIAA